MLSQAILNLCRPVSYCHQRRPPSGPFDRSPYDAFQRSGNRSKLTVKISYGQPCRSPPKLPFREAVNHIFGSRAENLVSTSPKQTYHGNYNQVIFNTNESNNHASRAQACDDGHESKAHEEVAQNEHRLDFLWAEHDCLVFVVVFLCLLLLRLRNELSEETTEGFRTLRD